MKNLILIFLLTLSILCAQTTIGQTNYSRKNVNYTSTIFSATYEGLTCFTCNCLHQKLKIKKNYKYSYAYFASGTHISERKKNVEKGSWKLDGEILTLTPDKSKKSHIIREPTSFKMYHGNLWYYSKETLQIDELAFKRR